MQKKEDRGIITKIFTDKVGSFGYLSFLGQDSFYSIKVSGDPTRSPFKHLFNPNYLITVDLIKTKKNWILKDVYHSEKLHTAGKYKAYTQQAEIAHLINTYIKRDQETHLIEFIAETLRLPDPDSFDIQRFEYNLLQLSGFATHKSHDQEYSDDLHKAKHDNDLKR